ncbi:protein moonraker isoform X2 [Anguilla rostrata]|uniref:protein moonraker isoform X2 n=1 Tax=Anguilla rostrata TaxID=7938 RepID=UPI0030CE8FFC
MTGKFRIRSQLTCVDELGHLNGSWVASGSAQTRNEGYPQTQLLFNKALPASTSNRVTHVNPPAPIVIEKLVTGRTSQNGSDSVRSSLCFSALSEERLQAAVRLARRDLQRRRQESILGSPPQQTPQGADHRKLNKAVSAGGAAGPKGTRSGAQVLLYTPQKLPLPPGTELGLSPPTRDSGPQPKASGQEAKLSQEICRLQKELGTYIQRIEQLANRGQHVEERLDPDEERRVEIRRQEQAARSARIIYVLQQQVKGIQEDLDKLRSQKIKHTKKSRAVDRLAAAHRGAVRAIQVFISQLPDQSERKMPSHYRELGQLIRQLSLCSAKVEAGLGSSVPETAIDILQKVEALDSALTKQERGRPKEPRASSSSPARRRSPGGRQHSASPPRAPRASAARGPAGPRRPAALKKNLPDRRLPAAWPDGPLNRDEVLRAGLDRLIRARGLGGGAPRSHRGPPQPEKPKKRTPLNDGRVQKPTVSSRLKEAQMQQKDASIPWIPTSPHASPPQLAQPQPRSMEPRCLFSQLKQSAGQGEQRGPPSPPSAPGARGLDAEQRREAHSEAVRQAWVDKETTRRLRELGQLSKEESERIGRLREEVGSPTLWAQRAESEARDRLQPLLTQAQQIRESWDRKAGSLRHRLCEQATDRAAVSAELLSEAILEDVLEDTAQALWAAERSRDLEQGALQLLQAPTLESMLLRMEEMEKDQEVVRLRLAGISYSNLLFSAKDDGTAPDPRPSSPRPLRLTRPALRGGTAADIVLEGPVEAGAAFESSLSEDTSPLPSPTKAADPPTVERGGAIPLSLPVSMQRSMLAYRQDFESYLRLVSHEAVGSFNPWAIADSLAEELMDEALSDVAAEFQDVCEEYAEAVFTSEFLQPLQSPVTSHSAKDSQ